jgi:CheY-like chemotaxis protein
MTKKKVLVVDDEHDIVKITLFRLQSYGYELLSAFNGEDALKIVIEQHPDVVLLDAGLPKMSGFEVCEKIKADKKLKNIPIIVYTADTSNILEKVKKCKADDYLFKPFETEELIKKVQKWLG